METLTPNRVPILGTIGRGGQITPNNPLINPSSDFLKSPFGTVPTNIVVVVEPEDFSVVAAIAARNCLKLIPTDTLNHYRVLPAGDTRPLPELEEGE